MTCDVETTVRTGGRISSASRAVAGASETEVRVGQVLMTCDLDREVGIGVAVDVALDNGEVSVARVSNVTASCPAAVGAPVTSVKLWSPAVPILASIADRSIAVAGLEADNGVAVGCRSRRELEGVVAGTAVHHVDCVARGDGVVAGAGIDVLDSPDRVVTSLGAGRGAVRQRARIRG